MDAMVEIAAFQNKCETIVHTTTPILTLCLLQRASSPPFRPDGSIAAALSALQCSAACNAHCHRIFHCTFLFSIA